MKRMLRPSYKKVDAQSRRKVAYDSSNVCSIHCSRDMHQTATNDSNANQTKLGPPLGDPDNVSNRIRFPPKWLGESCRAYFGARNSVRHCCSILLPVIPSISFGVTRVRCSPVPTSCWQLYGGRYPLVQQPRCASCTRRTRTHSIPYQKERGAKTDKWQRRKENIMRSRTRLENECDIGYLAVSHHRCGVGARSSE